MKLSMLNPGLWPASAFRPRPFEDAFEHFAKVLGTPEQATQPPLNAWETEDKFFVEYAVPGFSLEEIEVTVQGRTLTVSGNRSTEASDGESYHRRERVESAFTRTIELEVPVDADAVSAELRHGVLTIELPKAEEARPRRIEVRT